MVYDNSPQKPCVHKIIWQIPIKRQGDMPYIVYHENGYFTRIDREQVKQYEGIGEWYEEQQKREIAMHTAIKEVLLTDRYDGERFICCENSGKLYKLDTDSVLLDGAMELIWRYEELLQEGGNR